MIKDLGYTKPLYIMPFDHRSTFIKNMLEVKDRNPNEQEIEQVHELKHIIYEGFQKAVFNTIPKDHAAILVDEQFGDAIIRDAIFQGYNVILTIEKSGQEEFDFEYGGDFVAHIEKYKPAFVKALIRYNPEGDKEVNRRQIERLKTLGDSAHQYKYKLLVESLVPPTASQLGNINNDQRRFDSEVRPNLETRVVKEFQAAGIEPDVWKVEGMEQKSDYEELVKQARSGGRDQVGIVVLGRGADASQVEKWVSTGAQVEGVIGFAVGRTVFWDPLTSYRDNKTTRDQTIEQIAKNFEHFYDIFTKAKVI